MTQREALGTPAASSAACSCAAVALLAEAFGVDEAAAVDAVLVAAGAAVAILELAVALDAGAAAAPPHATSATVATMSAVRTCLISAFSVSGIGQGDHPAAPAA